MTLTSDTSPFSFLGRKNPADRQGSHSPALVRAFRRPPQRQRAFQKSSLAKIPLANVRLELNDQPILNEIQKATMQLKVGMPSGIDGIIGEVYQHRGMQCSISPMICSQTFLRKGILSDDLRGAVIVSLCKNKGGKSDCSNY